jgi:flagellar protein FliO/FliZ
MIARHAAASWMAAAVIGLTATARADVPAHADVPASTAAAAVAAVAVPAPVVAAPVGPAVAPAVAAAPEAAPAGPLPSVFAAAPAAAEPGTPLALRPSKPLELAKEPPSGGSLGWKIVAILLVLGGVALFARKRLQPVVISDARLNIVRRTGIGLRSELVIVDVDGQRLLLGVTPSSIQMLATLEGEDAPGALAASLGSTDERFAALLDAADRRSSRPRVEAASASQPARDPREEAAPDPDEVAGQARGLLALRGRR